MDVKITKKGNIKAPSWLRNKDEDAYGILLSTLMASRTRSTSPSAVCLTWRCSDEIGQPVLFYRCADVHMHHMLRWDGGVALQFLIAHLPCRPHKLINIIDSCRPHSMMGLQVKCYVERSWIIACGRVMYIPGIQEPSIHLDSLTIRSPTQLAAEPTHNRGSRLGCFGANAPAAGEGLTGPRGISIQIDCNGQKSWRTSNSLTYSLFLHLQVKFTFRN